MNTLYGYKTVTLFHRNFNMAPSLLICASGVIQSYMAGSPPSRQSIICWHCISLDQLTVLVCFSLFLPSCLLPPLPPLSLVALAVPPHSLPSSSFRMLVCLPCSTEENPTVFCWYANAMALAIPLVVVAHPDGSVTY